MLLRLDHVQIAVRDLEAATDRYSRLLGFRPAWRSASGELGAATSVFRLGNSAVQLVAPEGEGALGHLARHHLDSEGEGPLALTFETDDASACAEELTGRGLRSGTPVEGEDTEITSGQVRRWRAVPIASRAARGVRMFAVEYLDDPMVPPEPLAPPDQRASGIDHVVIQTHDPEATLSVYGAGLGIRLALDRSFESREVRLMFFRIAGVTLEVAARLGGPSDPAACDRLWGVAYQVSDVEATRKRLKGLEDFDVSEVRTGHKPGTSVCTVRSETHGVATLLIGPDV